MGHANQVNAEALRLQSSERYDLETIRAVELHLLRKHPRNSKARRRLALVNRELDRRTLPRR